MTPDDNVANTGGGGDVVVTDQQLFDHATAPEPAAQAPAPEPAPATQQGDQQGQPQPTPQQQDAAQRQRDEQGRFARQQPGQQPPQQQPQVPQQQPRTEDHRVPLAELHKERQRAQRAEAEAEQMRQAWQQFQYMQQQEAMRRQQPQEPEQPPQTIFDNPDQYLAHTVMNPLRQEGQMAMMQIKDGLSREMANQQFGEQYVTGALQDLASIRHTPQGNFVFNQIMQSGHPYGALVKWHHTAKAQQAIGPDPQAWLQKQQQAWFNDPTVQAKMIEHVRTQQQRNGNGQRPPQVNLPPSLSSLPSASGRIEQQGDLSNDSLYRYATK